MFVKGEVRIPSGCAERFGGPCDGKVEGRFFEVGFCEVVSGVGFIVGRAQLEEFR